MDWSQYRTSHLETYGPTTRQQLSKDYQLYKKNLKLKSPSIRPSLLNASVKSRSPAKAVKPIVRSPAKVVQPIVRSPVKTIVNKSKKLTLKDIEQMAKNKKFLIIVLYADWCSHCSAMREKLGPKMKNTDKIMFYNDEMIDQSLTNSFPKIMYYENGERQNDLTVDDVYDYLL